MAIQRGRNWGITGIVNLGASPQFTVEVRAFKQGLDTLRKNRAGRGQGAWRKSRATAPGGNLVLSGKVTLKGYPVPATWRGQRGTLVITYNRGAKETLEIEVEGVSFSSKQVQEDRWDVTISCVILANPSFEGFGGTQASSTTPAQTDVELYEGLSKTQDPKGIQDGAQTMFDVWPLGDTDAAENARIAAVVAATAPPFAYAKVKTATLQPGRDSEGGTVTITWSLTDTEEDILNRIESQTIDANQILTEAVTAGISTAPADPGGNLVLYSTTISEINDQKTLTVKTWKLLDSKDAIEYPGTPTGDDPYDLKDQSQITLVTASSTPPAVPSAPGGQHVATTTTRINRVRWQHVFSYANLNSEQEIEFPAAVKSEDTSALESSDVRSDVTDSSTPPADPTPLVSGLVLRVRRSRRVGGEPEKWLHTWEFGVRTTEEDITFPGTVTDDEVSHIADEAKITLVTSSNTPPATPAAPVGQLLSIESQQITDAGKWKHVFKYGNTTALQRIQFPTDTIETDPSGLKDEDAQSAVAATSTIPVTPSTRVAGLVLRRTSSVRIAGTPEKWLHRWFFGRTTTAEDITFPGTVTTPDVSQLDDKATITLITSSSTPAAAPAAPVGQHVRTSSEQLTDAGKWKHTYFYANNTSAQDVAFPDSPRSDDPSNLLDSERIAIIQSSPTPPSTPTPNVGGVKIRQIESKRLAGTPEQWEHVFVFARRNSEDDVEMDGTTYNVDPSALEDRVEITVVEADGTPDGGVTVAGLVLRDTKKRQLHDNAWAITYIFARTTSEEDVTYPGTVTVSDPKTLISEATVTLVNSSGTYPVALDTPPSGLKLRRVHSERLTDAGKWKHRAEYGLRDTEDDVEMDGTVYSTDPSALEDKAEITVVESDATPDGGVTVSGLVLRGYRKKQLHDLKWSITYIFGRTTTEEDVTFPGTVNNDDPSNLLDRATVTLVNSSSTYPVALDTPPAGLKLRDIESRQLTDSGKWRHTATYGRRSTEDDVEMNGTSYATDSSALEDTAEITVVEADGTPDGGVTVAGLVLRFTKRKQIHDTKWEITYVFGRRTTEEDLTFPGTVSKSDPSVLVSSATVTLVNSSATYPAALNTPPAGLKLRHVDSEQVTDAGKWKHTGTYGLRSTEDDIEMEGSVDLTDSSSIKDEYYVSVVTNTSTHSAPGAASGFVLRTSKLRQLHDTRWEHVYEYGRKTVEDDYEFDGSHLVADAEDLDDEVLISEVQGSATPNAAAASPPAGLLLRVIRSKQLTSGNTKWLHTYHYARNTSKTEIENNNSHLVEDDQVINTSAEVTEVFTTASGIPTEPAAQDSGGFLETYDRVIKNLNNLKSKVTTRQRLVNPKTEIEYAGTRVEYDYFKNVTKTVTEILASDASTDDLETLAEAYRDSVKSDVTIDSFHYERINSQRIKRVVNYVDQYNIFEGAGAPYRIPKQTFLIGGIVFVNVAEVFQRGSGLYDVLLTPLTVWGWRFDFRLTRRTSVSTIPLRYPYFNTVNSDTFLGFGATGVTYLGPRPRSNGNIVNPHVIDIGYDFSFDVNGWNDEAGVRMGWIVTDSNPGLGLKPAATFGWAASGLPGVDYTPAFA